MAGVLHSMSKCPLYCLECCCKLTNVRQLPSACCPTPVLPAGKQIVLRPGHLHFGSIPQGAVVHRTAKLLNGSADVVRFTIVRPELPLRCVDCVYCETICTILH
jgi:hypothetical protein